MFLMYTKYVGSVHTSTFTHIGETANVNSLDMHLETYIHCTGLEQLIVTRHFSMILIYTKYAGSVIFTHIGETANVNSLYMLLQYNNAE